VEFKTVRSKRKTIAIYILKDATVEVRCPFKVPYSVICDFVNLKSEWINKKVIESKNAIVKNSCFTVNYNSKLILMGNEYPITKGKTAYFYENCFYIPENNFKENLIALYKKLAKDIITKKVIHFSDLMGVKPFKIKINSAKTRWGSCSGKNSINFTYKLIMADEKAVDYVIIHELAHIREHNHSNRFWSIVENYLPDYKIQKENLRKLLSKLSNECSFWDK